MVAWEGSPEILDVLTVIQGHGVLAQQCLAGRLPQHNTAGHDLERLAEGCARLTELVRPFAGALAHLPRTAEIDALLILLDYYTECAEAHLHRVLAFGDPCFQHLAAVRSACVRLRHLLPPLRRGGSGA